MCKTPTASFNWPFTIPTPRLSPMAANAVYSQCQQALHGLCLKYGAAVDQVAEPAAVWALIMDQKVVPMPSVELRSQQDNSFVFVQAVQAVAIKLVAVLADFPAGSIVRPTAHK